MKTFFDLIQEIQKPGLCHRCGGCVTFCSAVNYGALELDVEGKPRYGEIEKCIECGLPDRGTRPDAEEGWTAVITRSPLGRAAFADAAGAGKLEEYSLKANPNYATQALARVRTWSAKKRKNARKNRGKLGARGVQIKSGAA